MNELIQKLSHNHEKRPVWKNRLTLLIGWAGFNFIYFFSMSLFGKDLSLSSTFLFPVTMFLVSILSWLLFSQFLNQESEKPAFLFGGLLFTVVLGAFLYENFEGHSILHQRGFSFTNGDFNCFFHSVLRAMVPAIMFPFLMKQFYVIQNNAALFIGAIHLTMMSLILTELRCADREMWHLLLGHQSSLIGISLFLLGIFYLFRKKAF